MLLDKIIKCIISAALTAIGLLTITRVLDKYLVLRILSLITIIIAVFILLHSIFHINIIEKKLAHSCSVLESKISDLTDETIKLKQNCNQFETENEKFRKNLENQKKANMQLLEIQKQSQNLLTNLMQSGDKFTDFGKVLEDTANKNLTLSDKLQILVGKLSKEQFEKLDKNHDGFITIDELEN